MPASLTKPPQTRNSKRCRAAPSDAGRVSPPYRCPPPPPYQCPPPPLIGALPLPLSVPSPPLPQTTNVSRAATGGGGVGLSRLGSSAMLDGGDQDRERQRKRRVSAWFQGGCWGRGQASLTQHMRRVGGLGLKWFWGEGFRVGSFRPIPLPLLRPPPLPAGSRFRQR